jgi:hypothetical protein
MELEEKQASELIDFSLKLGMSLSYLLPFGPLPYLTDEECRKLAMTTPYSFADIRSTFPTRHDERR